jgi:hypothetical protein
VNNTYDLMLGAGPNAGYYNGALDEVRIYDRALTEKEVVTLYKLAAPKGTAGVLSPMPRSPRKLAK